MGKKANRVNSFSTLLALKLLSPTSMSEKLMDLSPMPEDGYTYSDGIRVFSFQPLGSFKEIIEQAFKENWAAHPPSATKEPEYTLPQHAI